METDVESDAGICLVHSEVSFLVFKLNNGSSWKGSSLTRLRRQVPNTERVARSLSAAISCLLAPIHVWMTGFVESNCGYSDFGVGGSGKAKTSTGARQVLIEWKCRRCNGALARASLPRLYFMARPRIGPVSVDEVQYHLHMKTLQRQFPFRKPCCNMNTNTRC